MSHFEGDQRIAAGARFAIVASRWNSRIVDALVSGARKVFAEHGLDEANLDVVRVPGAWELPLVAADMPASSRSAAWCAAIRAITSTWPTVAPTG